MAAPDVPGAAARRLDPDDLIGDMEWGRDPAQRLMASNPDLAVFQMHDPVHDRLMVTRMAYFRIKRRRLGAVYREFMNRVLPTERTIVIVDCRLRRQVTRLDSCHLYQVGGLGSTTPDEYLHGGPRVARFLEEQGAAIRSWMPPPPTDGAPEAEWGYLDELDEEILAFAKSGGHDVKRLVFEEPQDLSDAVADVYQAWLRGRGIDPVRLIAENFALLAPWHVLRSGAVPYWLPFNTEPGDAALETYLRTRGPFDEAYLMLLSNGVDAIGLVPVDRWKQVLRHARRTGRFLGVDEREYPRDFASFVRYYSDLEKHVRARVPIPAPLTIEGLDRLRGEMVHNRRVRWESAS